eukprot:155632_1
MSTAPFMKIVVVFWLLCILNIYGQWAPQWGTIECDSTITGRFLEGDEFHDVVRYYAFTASYPTSISRDVYISTCVLEQESNQHDRPLPVFIANEGRLLDPYYPSTTSSFWYTDDDDTISCPDDDSDRSYVGLIYQYEDLAAGEYLIGIYNDDEDRNDGGMYTLSVECYDPPTPPPSEAVNYTMQFTNYTEWQSSGSKDISCDLDVTGNLEEPGDTDWYQFEILSYATEIQITTCSSFIDTELIQYSYWNFNTSAPREWILDVSNDGSCGTITLTDSYQISPGIYYLSIENTDSFSSSPGKYILSMQCWNDNSIKSATTYSLNTPSPTIATTSNPTSANPTNYNTSFSPTSGPTTTWNIDSIKDKKEIFMGDISCGIHRHNKLNKKTYHWYKFEVT